MATVQCVFCAKSSTDENGTVQLNPINDLHTLPFMSQATIVRNGLQAILSPAPIRTTSIYNMFNGFQLDAVCTATDIK